MPQEQPSRRGLLGSLAALIAWREACRASGRSVAWTNGCFDLLHAGHARSLQAAARLADALVVGVNSDDSVRCLKGSARPLVPQAERAELVAALGCVERVVIFNELTPEAVLARLRPDVHVKGADYAPPHGKPIPERALVESYGGRVEFIPLVEGLSTTNLVERIAALPQRPAGPPRPAVFLGRDGTLIEDTGYPRGPALVRILPGAAEALRRLESVGLLLVVVSNQSGIGRGLITPREAEAVHARFVEAFASQGVRFACCYYCPHAPESGCPCRKPSPGLLLRACADHNIDLRRSFLVGDKPSGAEAALRAGCTPVLLGRDARGWGEAVALILGEASAGR